MDWDRTVACRGLALTADGCAQGAVAHDAVEGDISSFVDACASGYRFSSVGLAGCDLDTQTPGTYTLNFSVLDTATNEPVSVSRTVTVLPECPSGETVCIDNSCSVGGVCVAGLAAEPAANNAPVLLQLGSDKLDVQVPAGTSFEACASGGVASEYCEPGFGARDIEDGDLTEFVLACPPADCLVFGCPGHEFAVKGTVQRHTCKISAAQLCRQDDLQRC